MKKITWEYLRSLTQPETNPETVKRICKFLEKKFHIVGTYTITSDGKVKVDGYVNFGMGSLNSLPVYFTEVSEKFDCSCNNLLSLAGCPESVGGDFYCYKNKLTSLDGCPQSIGGNLDYSHNKITSTDIGAVTVGGSVNQFFKYWNTI
jgi:hypothetical protein